MASILLVKNKKGGEGGTYTPFPIGNRERVKESIQAGMIKKDDILTIKGLGEFRITSVKQKGVIRCVWLQRYRGKG